MWQCCCRESLRKTPTTIHLKDGERLVGDPAVAAVCIVLIHVALHCVSCELVTSFQWHAYYIFRHFSAVCDYGGQLW